MQPIDDDTGTRLFNKAPGGEKGQTLYIKLDERHRAMARRPLLLWLIKEAGKSRRSPSPATAGELYARVVSGCCRRDTKRRMDAEIPEL